MAFTLNQVVVNLGKQLVQNQETNALFSELL